MRISGGRVYTSCVSGVLEAVVEVVAVVAVVAVAVTVSVVAEDAVLDSGATTGFFFSIWFVLQHLLFLNLKLLRFHLPFGFLTYHFHFQ